jgi:predicted permease
MLADLRTALRSLRRHPGFTAAVALTLALGLGANTAIFSVVNAVLLRGLPYAQPERLVMAFTTYPDFGHSATSLPDFLDWRDGAAGAVELAAVANTTFNLTGGGAPERATGAVVTANYFPLLGAAPAVGRGFTAEEERGGAPKVVVLGHDFWRRRFGGDASAVGRALVMNGVPYTVVGVAPTRLDYPTDVDLWIPLRTDTTRARRAEFLSVVGRLRPGVTVERARDALATVGRRLQEQYPETNSPRLSIDLVPMRDEIVGGARASLLVFMGAVGLVLLVACANLANLLLVRATTREREVAIRSALGADRGRVFRQMLAESLALAALGGALGVTLAFAAVRALRASGLEALPRLDEVGLDGRALAFAAVLSLATGVLFGLAPALRLSREELQGTLRGGGRGIAGHGGAQRLRAGLVLAEVALSILLLVGAGLLLRSFVEMQRSRAGFDPQRVLTLQVSLPRASYADAQRVRDFWPALLDRAGAVPGVRAAAVASQLPLTSSGYLSFSIEGRTPPPDAMEDVQPFNVSDGYFRALGVALVRGRVFGPEDGAAAPRVAVVNEEAARRFWPGRDPIGARITTGDTTDYMTVVGVVADVKQEGLTAKPYPQLYSVAAQNPMRGMYVVVKTAGEPQAAAAAMRRVIAGLDPELPVYGVMPMTERVSKSVARPRLTALLVGVFAAVALALAAVGIYGVVAFAVAQRTRELGVRMALGATTADVRRLVIGQGMAPVVGGLVLGVGLAAVATRAIGGMLYGVSALDPLTYLAVALFLASVALAATWLPSRRAVRVPPAVVLREE